MGVRSVLRWVNKPAKLCTQGLLRHPEERVRINSLLHGRDVCCPVWVPLTHVFLTSFPALVPSPVGCPTTSVLPHYLWAPKWVALDLHPFFFFSFFFSATQIPLFSLASHFFLAPSYIPALELLSLFHPHPYMPLFCSPNFFCSNGEYTSYTPSAAWLLP